MNIFKYKHFHHWARAEGLDDKTLKVALDEIARGLVEANSGGGLYKKRIARKGQGKRSGYRTIIAFKQDDRAIFMFGFAKNERENMHHREKELYKRLASYYLIASDTQIARLVEEGELFEVKR